jgi:alpha-amylase
LDRNGLKPSVYFTGGEAVTASQYTDFGGVTEFKYGAELGNAFRGNNPIKYLQNFGMSKM